MNPPVAGVRIPVIDRRAGEPIDRWIRSDGQILLREIGLRPCYVVLDFGCGSGAYTLPASKVVGQCGRIFALDRENKRSIESFSDCWAYKKLERRNRITREYWNLLFIVK